MVLSVFNRVILYSSEAKSTQSPLPQLPAVPVFSPSDAPDTRNRYSIKLFQKYTLKPHDLANQYAIG